MRFYIEGEEINPREWTNIGQVREFAESDNKIMLTTTSVKLWGRAYEIVYDWVYNRYGRFINIPVEGVPKSGPAIQLYLDIRAVLEFNDKPEVTTNIVLRKSSNHFFDGASALTFEAIYAKGLLTGFTNVPYQILADTTRLERLILIVNELLMLIQLAQAVFELVKLISDGLDIVGTGVLTAIGKAVAYAAWVVGLLVVFIQQAIELKRIYAPPIRTLYSMSDYKLIKAGCEYLGFQFVSGFISDRQEIETLPVTEQQPGKSFFKLFEYQLAGTVFNKGYPRAGDSVRVLQDLIDWWLKWFNLEIKVADGIVRIETPEYFAATTSVVLETALPDQDWRANKWTYNNGENRVWRRKFLSWTPDPQDRHTQDIVNYNVAEYQTTNVNIPPGCEDLAIMKGYWPVQAPFALLRRKDELFPLEKLIYKFFKLVDKVVNAFGGSSNLAAEYLDARIGIGIISNQIYGITKKIWNRGDGKQPEDYLTVRFNTDTTYTERHLPLEVKEANSMWVDMRVPMHDETFQLLQSNNYAFLDVGGEAKVIRCEHFDEDDHRWSNIKIQMSDPSGFNTTTVKIQ